MGSTSHIQMVSLVKWSWMSRVRVNTINTIYSVCGPVGVSTCLNFFVRPLLVLSYTGPIHECSADLVQYREHRVTACMLPSIMHSQRKFRDSDEEYMLCRDGANTQKGGTNSETRVSQVDTGRIKANRYVAQHLMQAGQSRI